MQNKIKIKDDNIKQINISFNLSDKEDAELYKYFKELSNTTSIVKDCVREHKLKSENQELYIKNFFKEYMTTREFNKNLKTVLQTQEMSNFLRNICEDIVISEIKNYMKYH